MVHFTTTRREGSARIPGVLAAILRSRGLPGSVAMAEQIHGAGIVVVPALKGPKVYSSADGLLTIAPRQPLAIFTADCLPVFLAAPDRGAVGLLHAGWRGVKAGILPEALRILDRRWHVRPRDLSLWFGPVICRRCFQVRWDVARHFRASRRRKGDRWFVDLQKEMIGQARRAGILLRRIRISGDCTRHGRRFYSYRRDRTEKRQVSVIMATQENFDGNA